MTEHRAAANAYDAVAFPSLAIPATHPDHLAAIARLHGLSPPPVERARVLDLGGGDGMNLIAMAEALPDAWFLSLDLATQPVARGQRIVRAAGIANVRVEVGDIIEAAATLEGPFDYVVAHGVYAWVPEPVRAALMALLGRVLSADGVAYLSYNALPGGHLRRIVREMVLHQVADVADPSERFAAAQAFLTDYAEPRDGDPAPLAGLRTIAAKAARSGIGALLHDDLGEVFEPQAFADVIAAAARQGLRFLNDADPTRLADGLPGEAMADDRLVRSVQSRDFAELRYFHKTALVRAECVPHRAPRLEAMRDLYAAAPCEQTGPAAFRTAGRAVTISDPAMAGALTALVAGFPGRLRLGTLIADDARLAACLRLVEAGLMTLHTVPGAWATVPGDRPRASGLARALVADGCTTLYGLDHRTVVIEEAGPRALIPLLDGSRDRAALDTAWRATGQAGGMTLDEALAGLARLSLLSA